MYAKLLIKQAQARRGYEPGGVTTTTTVGPRETPPSKSVLANLKDMADDPEEPYHHSAKFLDSILRVPGKMWQNPVETAIGATFGAWGATTGRELASKHLRAGRSNGSLMSLRPQPIKTLSEAANIYRDQGGRTPAKAFKDIYGSVSRRDFVNQVKPRANPFKVIGETISVGRKRTGAPKGNLRALAEKFSRGGFGNLMFRKKPNAKAIIASILAGSIATAVAAAKFKGHE